MSQCDTKYLDDFQQMVFKTPYPTTNETKFLDHNVKQENKRNPSTRYS